MFCLKETPNQNVSWAERLQMCRVLQIQALYGGSISVADTKPKCELG